VVLVGEKLTVRRDTTELHEFDLESFDKAHPTTFGQGGRSFQEPWELVGDDVAVEEGFDDVVEELHTSAHSSETLQMEYGLSRY
jgi:hypothetical protein